MRCGASRGGFAPEPDCDQPIADLGYLPELALESLAEQGVLGTAKRRPKPRHHRLGAMHDRKRVLERPRPIWRRLEKNHGEDYVL